MQTDAEDEAKYGQKPSVRERILYNGAKLTAQDRNETYGEPVESMQDIAGLWSAYLYGRFGGKTVDPMQFEFTGQDVAHMLTLLKMARTFTGAYHFDNYVDSATYQAIAGECAVEECGHEDD